MSGSSHKPHRLDLWVVHYPNRSAVARIRATTPSSRREPPAAWQGARVIYEREHGWFPLMRSFRYKDVFCLEESLLATPGGVRTKSWPGGPRPTLPRLRRADNHGGSVRV